ncbi:unnamed protein product [marine sediment metagenome]|uniref:Ester cyclase n=2 Tax=marine sediment metagenome TaxID=412755 RepID=X0Z9J9_9ZZZZ
MSIEENKSLPRRSYEEIYNQGNLDVADDIYDENFVIHMSPSDLKGTKSIKEYALMLRNAFPDLKFKIEDQIAEGDKVATRWVVIGTHKGEYMGVAATGKFVSNTGISLHRIIDGKMVESWVSSDNLGVMQKLGAVSLPRQK